MGTVENPNLCLNPDLLLRLQVIHDQGGDGVRGRDEKVASLHIDDAADAREEMASEEITEERKTFQISGVTDPESGDMMPLSDAIAEGIIDEDRGLYMNPLTGLTHGVLRHGV